MRINVTADSVYSYETFWLENGVVHCRQRARNHSIRIAMPANDDNYHEWRMFRDLEGPIDTRVTK